MEFISKQLQDYCHAYTSPESNLLNRIHRETHLEVPTSRMLSGFFQGRYLSMLSYMIKPKSILEIGTYTGYSTLCLAEGLAEGGKLTTLDKDMELEDRVRGYFEKAGLSEKIDFRLGDALNIIPRLKQTFDFVFIDADKINYSNYFDLVIDKVVSGGYLLADNVLWSGKVIAEGKKDEDTEAICNFNQKIQSDPRIENILLPIRDGLLLMRKL